MTLIHAAMQLPLRGDPVDRLRIAWSELAKVPLVLPLYVRGTPAGLRLAICFILMAILAASVNSVRELVGAPLWRIGRLGGGAVERGKAFGTKLLAHVGNTSATSAAWSYQPHHNGRAAMLHAVPVRIGLNSGTDIDGPRKKRTRVTFAMKTYDALTRIAAGNRDNLPHALKKSIMLTDFLNTEVRTGARVFIEREGVVQELVL